MRTVTPSRPLNFTATAENCTIKWESGTQRPLKTLKICSLILHTESGNLIFLRGSCKIPISSKLH